VRFSNGREDLDKLNSYELLKKGFAILGGLVVSVLATGPLGITAAGSGPAKDGRLLWEIKIHSSHFLWRGSKAVGPMS
jgi:hypothetical protein